MGCCTPLPSCGLPVLDPWGAQNKNSSEIKMVIILYVVHVILHTVQLHLLYNSLVHFQINTPIFSLVFPLATCLARFPQTLSLLSCICHTRLCLLLIVIALPPALVLL